MSDQPKEPPEEYTFAGVPGLLLAPGSERFVKRQEDRTHPGGRPSGPVFVDSVVLYLNEDILLWPRYAAEKFALIMRGLWREAKKRLKWTIGLDYSSVTFRVGLSKKEVKAGEVERRIARDQIKLWTELVEKVTPGKEGDGDE